MACRAPLLAGILVSGILLGACDNGSTRTTPTTPTPTATVTPTPTPAPPPPAAEPATLASLTLNASTVGSQGNLEGTVTLTAAAPAGNAVVALSSGNPEVARVPANVTIPAGSISSTFRIETSTVGAASTVTIIATYAGVTRTAPLTVLSPPLEPRFTVTSPQRGADACDIINSGGALDCRFNASTSLGIVARYLWTMKVGSTEASFSAADGEAEVTPVTSCGLLGNGTSDDGKIAMEVSLQLEDRNGNRSAIARRTVTVHHNFRCGY